MIENEIQDIGISWFSTPIFAPYLKPVKEAVCVHAQRHHTHALSMHSDYPWNMITETSVTRWIIWQLLILWDELSGSTN